MNKTLRLFLLLALAFLTPLAGYTKNYQTAGTGFIGGITLFDEANPLLSLNNPGLLNNYGAKLFEPGRILIDFDYNKSYIDDDGDDFNSDFDFLDATVDPRVYQQTYGFGRLFFLNVFISTAVSSDTVYQSSYFMNLAQGTVIETPYTELPGLGQVYYKDIVSALTFGIIDISPVFYTNNLSSAGQVSNLLEILKNGKIGVSTEININVLSYYRHHFGITFYVASDIKAGFFGDDKNLLLVQDPTVDLELQSGFAFGMGLGVQDIPLIGKVMLGYTIRVFAEIAGHTETLDDALLMYKQLINYQTDLTNTHDIFNFSAFGNGEYLRGGFGLSLDFGFYKPITPNFIVGGKLSDIISPRYWLKSGLADPYFGWKLPDLSLGFRYMLPLTKSIWFIVNEPTFYCQVDDLLYTYPVSFLAKLHVGFDIKLLFDIFQIGAGLNAGYPTLGFTIHLTPAVMGNIPVLNIIPIWYFHLKIHFSLYGKELGRYPGEFGFQGYNLALEFYLGI